MKWEVRAWKKEGAMGRIQLLIADDDSATREMMGAFFKERDILFFLRKMERKPCIFLGKRKLTW